MKKKITLYICDVCKKEVEEKDLRSLSLPVMFHSDQTEGKPCSPYISIEKMDICKECLNKAVTIHGMGAQGVNTYKIKPAADEIKPEDR